ncbi:Macrophage erythroblast attacher [Toxocara canis]|uniref:E3 ubiquitin-protein transferase MAEA n=2 Tax=Toxocara canis TaxID=6265 RepID=A0A0B2V0U6_TOXCA|nr:Macrophage erythroblast attacher [Toxocara canis]
MNGMPKIDEITALEYTSLKVPYELLNKRFRTAQKSIDRHNFRVREAANELSKQIEAEKVNDIITVAPQTQTMMERLDALQESFSQVVADEMSMAKLLQSRINYLKEANTDDAWKRETWKQQRINRLIIDHLLRSGYFETAQKLAEQSDVEVMCNKSIFMIAKQVEDSLSRHETDRCIEWIMDNKSKLRRLKSNLEIALRIQECIEMVKKGQRMQAVMYARKHFSTLPPQLWTGPVLKVMGLIGFGRTYDIESYKALCSDDKWDMLIELFRQENARIFQLMEHSSFNACLCMGMSAMKTPHCRPDPTSRCPICHPEINELAEDLPFAHTTNSRLVCPYSGEPLDENNPPFMLPNGRVYGERSIEKLCKDNQIECPRTREVFPLSQVVRVFVL